jgi:hypothetical protein
MHIQKDLAAPSADFEITPIPNEFDQITAAFAAMGGDHDTEPEAIGHAMNGVDRYTDITTSQQVEAVTPFLQFLQHDIAWICPTLILTKYCLRQATHHPH